MCIRDSSIAYGNVRNFAYFDLSDNSTYKRFVVNYIEVWQLHTNATYDKKINNLVSLKINADYYNWNEKVSHKPNITFDVSAPINLRDKIKVIPTFSYFGKRNSAVSQKDFKELPTQFHFNLALQYHYSKILSAYLHLNNLNGSNKELWRDYQEIGFNCVFGLSYSF